MTEEIKTPSYGLRPCEDAILVQMPDGDLLAVCKAPGRHRGAAHRVQLFVPEGMEIELLSNLVEEFELEFDDIKMLIEEWNNSDQEVDAWEFVRTRASQAFEADDAEED